jgi:tetratricopeptide (TPR) repeat protein
MLVLVLALALPPAADLVAVRALLAERRYAEAQEIAEVLITRQPGNAELQHLLGQLARQRRDLPTAVQHLARAVELDPTHAAYHHDYGAACGLLAHRSGRTWRAASLARRSRIALTRAVELDPAHVGYREALIEFMASAPALVGGGMERAHAEVAALGALDARAGLFAHAKLLEREKRHEELLRLWREQGAAHPDDYEIRYRHGLATLLARRNLESGIESLQRCLELSAPPPAPGHAWVHAALGQLHTLREDWPAARAAYTTAVVLDGRPAAWREALAALPEG